MRTQTLLIAMALGLGPVVTPNVTHASPTGQRLQPIHLAPSDLLNQGEKLAKAGDWARALSAYEQASDLDQQNPRIFSAIGYVQARLDNFAEAARAYQKAIALEPKNADFHYALGYSLGHLGDNAGSAAAYDQATRLDPRISLLYPG